MNDGCPRRVAIVGGTHGNERAGIHVVERMLLRPEAYSFPGLEVRPYLANLQAIEANTRYVDRDLNRCFGPALEEARADHPDYEMRRAFEIASDLRPDGEPYDLVVDLHNTTSQMGLTIMLSGNDPWMMYLAACLRERNPSQVRILQTPETPRSNVYLPSLGHREITVEIGPVAHGTAVHWAFEAADELVGELLHLLSENQTLKEPSEALSRLEFPYYVSQPSWDYPRDGGGKLAGIIHRDLQGRDYQPLRTGDPVFHLLESGETLRYEGSETLYPVFINEAAYYEKGIALTPTLRRVWRDGESHPE